MHVCRSCEIEEKLSALDPERHLYTTLFAFETKYSYIYLRCVCVNSQNYLCGWLYSEETTAALICTLMKKQGLCIPVPFLGCSQLHEFGGPNM